MAIRFDYRQQYDDEADEIERDVSTIICEDETKTIQGAPDADINELLARFGINDGSILPATLGVFDPRYYGDFSEIPDLRTALDNTRLAEQRFMELPADLRAEFNNDPYALYTWVTDPQNGEEAVKMGLLARRPNGPEPEPPAPLPPIPPAPAPAPNA